MESRIDIIFGKLKKYNSLLKNYGPEKGGLQKGRGQDDGKATWKDGTGKSVRQCHYEQKLQMIYSSQPLM